jgi:glutamine---fructose-6-phosphate transaminase (isomerizing)
MCGIIGYVGPRDAAPILLEGLRGLEYRGYDSAGIAVLNGGKLRVSKCQGRVRDLERQLPKRFAGKVGIAHTRWATHGEPSDRNAHPHCDPSDRIAVIHNGIVENSAALRAKLVAEGVEFRSDTDTEILAHLIAGLADRPLAEAVRAALLLVVGTYGLAVVDAERPDTIVVARNGSPIVLGIGAREMLVASDVAALVRHTDRVVHLDDGELAVVRADGFETLTLDGGATEKTIATIQWQSEELEKGRFADHMSKEIAEQPDAVRRTLSGKLDRRFRTARLGVVELAATELLTVRRVKILGCGSAYHASCIGAHLIEQMARIPATAETASEFRYRNPVIETDTLYIAVSQSGETFDTLAAVQEIKRKGGRVLGVVNVVGSTIARECGRGIYLHAGPEISVAATKSFTCMAIAFALLALHLGRIRDLSIADGERLLAGLEALPDRIGEILAREDAVNDLAGFFAHCDHAYFLGRAAAYPVAMEGALKMKELSYLHAEAYPASELKHGPLALIAPTVPSLIVVPNDELISKNASTIAEIKARKGPVLAVTNAPDLSARVDAVVNVRPLEPELDPILLNIPLQLLAYQVAAAKGRNIDNPRNLAKSVTVE